MKKPVIGMVVLHSCVRTHKIAWGLLLQGYEVHLVTERIYGGHGWKDYTATHAIHTGYFEFHDVDKKQIQSTIKSLESVIDVWHVHNEPDFMVEAIREVTEKPIVYDIHDMVSVRQDKGFEDEEMALALCDAVVVPSREYQMNIIKRVSKPVVQVLSCVPQALFPKKRTKIQLPGICYEGGLKGKPSDESEQFGFRSWAPVFKVITALGVPVWAYPNNSVEDLSEYKESGVMIVGPFDYVGMLGNLTCHEAAIVGSPFPDRAFEGALPNKLFDSIAAGLPIIAFNAPTVKQYVEAYNFGVGIESVDEIPDVLEQFRKNNFREEIWNMRKYHTMDRQVHKLESLYRELTGQVERQCA